jgi:hypothetical protein
MRYSYDIYLDGRVDKNVLLRWPIHGERAAFGVQDHSMLVVAGGQWRSTSQNEFDAVVRTTTQRETDER